MKTVAGEWSRFRDTVLHDMSIEATHTCYLSFLAGAQVMRALTINAAQSDNHAAMTKLFEELTRLHEQQARRPRDHA